MFCLNKKTITILSTLVGLLLLALNTLAQDDIPEAPIENDDGGPVTILGEVSYTNPFFTSGVAQPLIILEDQAGFVDRDLGFIFPPESQTIGQITSDFFTSPFSYSISLPIEPSGSLRDVDNDTEEDTGVMIFAVAYWNNTWGDPFLEVRDLSGGGWSGAYASTRVSSDPDMEREIIGGKFLVYAPDDEQGFPIDYGDDGLLFTGDENIVRLPQGYTVVDIDSEPFTFDRSSTQVIDLIEPEGAALIDYSDLSYTEAFDSMVDLFREEYAFTEYKNIDWDALQDEFRPLFERADAKGDGAIYLNALREFLWRIPDGHVNFSPITLIQQTFSYSVALGIGMGVRTTDDATVLVTYLQEGGPAEEAGIEIGDEILAINGEEINSYIDNTISWDQPFSTPHNLRLSQERYAMRFNADTREVAVTYNTPDDNAPITVELTPVNEIESLTETIPVDIDGFELPVEFDLLDSGYGYVAIYSFQDNDLLTIQLWERMIQQFQNANVRGIIIDMRQNGGGNGFLADQMSAYFFDEELVVGRRGFYSEETGDFVFEESSEQRLYLPPEELRYDGPVAVLVGPQCASACERFSYNFTIDERAEIVGQYPTAGLGGSVNDFRMPDGITVRFTVGRSVNAEGEIHIEGIGVVPTIDVPVTEETLFSEGDPVLEVAVAFLGDTSTTPTVDAGEIAVGDTVTGEIEVGQRIRYSLTLIGGEPVDIFVGNDDDSLTTVVRFYDLDGNLLLSNVDEQESDSGSSNLIGIGSQQDITVILEIGTFDDASEGEYTLVISESEES